MPRPSQSATVGRVRPVHRLQYLWEPLLTDPTFVLRPMFGGKAAYLDGRMVLYFTAKAEPWRGVLVCTDRVHHTALLADFPALVPHPVLPKWLYLAETDDHFETLAARLVRLARTRDPRVGIAPKSRRRSVPRPR